MRFIVTFLVILFVGALNAQDKPSTYVSEFRILVESLEELHPTLYTNISKEEFALQVKTIEKRLAETESPAKAIYIIQELFYSLKDSHSGNISIYKQDPEISKALPFSVYILGNQLYIKDYPSDPAYIGAEILSIEQTTSSQIIDSLKVFFPVDGSRNVLSSYAQMMFNGLYGIFCQQKDVFHVLTNRGTLLAKALVPGDESFRDFVLKPITTYLGENRILRAEIVTDYAYFQCVGFASKYNEFKIEKSFYELLKNARKKSIETLVIDLRHNSGGDPYMAGRMASCLTDKSFRIFENIYITPTRKPSHLDYMSEKKMYGRRQLRCRKSGELNQVVRFEKGLRKTHPKKNRFMGQIYVLTDGATQSSSTMFCHYLMNQSNVTFVGSETLGAINYFWAGRHCQISLPMLKTTFSFGLELIELNEECGNCGPPVGLIPDHLVNYTIEDLVGRRDLEMEFVVAYIRKRDELKH